MTAYIANHQKKNRIFAKRVRELVHAIKNGYSSEKLAVAAERVREAKMNVFKCRFAKSTVSQAHNFSPAELAAGDAKIREWLTMSTAEIIEKHRPKSS